jgi:chemotaxis protein MotB
MSDCECVETKCDAGIPAWVMTFADLMSLLLAFFVLLFSFSEMDKNIYKELAGSLKDAFGVQREIKAKETPRGVNIIAREFTPGRPQPTIHNEVRQMTTNELNKYAVLKESASNEQEKQSSKVDEELAAKARDLSARDMAIIKLIKKDSEMLRVTLDKEIDQELIDMKVTDKRIILMIREKGSFSSGSAETIEPFKVVAKKISKVFKEFDGVVIVSGHTDNIPINTYRFRSNWELSSSRAVSVIHELTKEDELNNKKFEISAFADTQPVDTNDTAVGRAKNRRVEIMMDYSNIILEENTSGILSPDANIKSKSAL